MQYPGRSKVEAAVRPAAMLAANQVMRGRLLDVLGWWHLRQHYSRSELVEGGICSRSASYRHEEHFEQIVGKSVQDASRSDLDQWVKSLAHQHQEQADAS